MSARVAVGRALVGAAILACAPHDARARIVLVQTERGPVWTNVPEPAGPALPRPGARRLPFLALIDQHAAEHDVDPRLVEAVIACESDFDPMAVSRAGAEGLMQLMPATQERLGVQDPFDAEQSVAAGTAHLSELLNEFGGDWTLAVAAYNAGSGAVRRAGGVPRFAETRQYVRKIHHYLGFLGATIALPPGDALDAEGVSFVGVAEFDPILDWTPPVEEVEKPAPRRRGPPAVITRNAAGRTVFTNRAGAQGRAP